MCCKTTSVFILESSVQESYWHPERSLTGAAAIVAGMDDVQAEAENAKWGFN